MQSTLPKQFLPLHGKPLLAHTLANLLKSDLINELLLVVPFSYLHHPIIQSCLPASHPQLKLIAGGAERQDSVYQALQRLDPAAELVLIHDGVRPFCDPRKIEQLVAACQDFAGAILALPIVDTVKEVADGVILGTQPRERLYLAQTPQIFHRSVITAAYEKARAEQFCGTDDAALVERIGGQIAVVPGDRRNLKITCQSDLEVAKFLLQNEETVW